ncbi:hypothetical protein JCM6882_007358 [Rhodosporidiobolus microsporus]
MLSQLLLILVLTASIGVQLLSPRLAVLNVWPKTRALHPALNVGECVRVEGLEACEDAWVDHKGGKAYLACSSLQARSVWQPADSVLDGPSALSTALLGQKDTLRLFDFATNTHEEVALHGMPDTDAEGGWGRVWTHGMDVLVHPPSPSSSSAGEQPEITILLISHRPPQPPSSAKQEGADSVVEVFSSRLGSNEARWVRTVRHPLLRTPNNLVGDAALLSPSSKGGEEGGEKVGFWLTNDHRSKTGWERVVETVFHAPSEVVYCEADLEDTEREAECKVAADSVMYPNGLAKGPNDLLYSASTYTGDITVWEIQHADKTLVPVNSIPIGRPIDNLHPSPSGALYAATFPLARAFGAAAPTAKDVDRPRRVKAPVEVWRVGNETGEGQFYGRQFRTSVALADPTGEVVSAITSAAPYGDKLLLTGYFTPHATVCRLAGVEL